MKEVAGCTTPVSPEQVNPERFGEGAIIRFAGHPQDGIQKIAGMLAQLAGRQGRDSSGSASHSTLSPGSPAACQVQLRTGEISSAGAQADFLLAFRQDSYLEQIGSLKAGGTCIYDSDELTPDRGDQRFRFLGVPMTATTVEVAGGSGSQGGKNLFALGLICRVFRLHREKLVRIVEQSFEGGHESLLRNAMLAFDAGFAYLAGDALHQAPTLQPATDASGARRIVADGNTALAQGLIAAGVRFGAARPVAPWSSVMEILRTDLPRFGGSFVQTEDELAAVSMALGFAYSGHLAVTGSTGQGLSLKMEALSWAAMAELPLLVVTVQRGGPSTGSPLHVEQGELLQAVYGGYGNCPRVVMAPKDVEDCFYVALHAAQIARKYRLPVLILTDQELATRTEAFEMPDLDRMVEEPAVDLSPRSASFRPYPPNGTTVHAVPGARMEGGRYPVVTGLEHDEWGRPSASPAAHQGMTAGRREKLRRIESGLLTPEVFGDATGEILLVGWGSTWGAIRETVQRLRTKRYRVSCVHIRHLHPLAPGLGEVMERFDSVFVVELNDQGVYGCGQLASLLRARFCNPRIRSICKTDGLSFQVSEIVAGIDRYVAVTL